MVALRLILIALLVFAVMFIIGVAITYTLDDVKNYVNKHKRRKL